METGTDEKLLIPQLYWPVPWIVAPAWFVIDPPLARKMRAPEVLLNPLSFKAIADLSVPFGLPCPKQYFRLALG